MSTYGELIASLKSFKNVKDKRHAIRTLASLCGNRSYQVRILRSGGWEDAIQPLLTSLDQECRHHAALAVANLSSGAETHGMLLAGGALRDLVRCAQEEDGELVVYVLTAMGNMGSSGGCWEEFRQLNALSTVLQCMKVHKNEQVLHACLFVVANLTADNIHREVMAKNNVLEILWAYLFEPNVKIFTQALLAVRGLSVHSLCRDALPRMGVVAFIVSVLRETKMSTDAKYLVVEILVHVSFGSNASYIASNDEAVACIHDILTNRDKYPVHSNFVPAGLCIVANMCEDTALHDVIIDGKLFPALMAFVGNDLVSIQDHLVRAVAYLTVTHRYHEKVLAASTHLLTYLLKVGLTPDIHLFIREPALQALAALTASRPTGLTPKEQEALVYVVCSNQQDVLLRRYAVTTLGNVASDQSNLESMRPFLDGIMNVFAVEGGFDETVVTEILRLFYNMVKLDKSVGLKALDENFLHVISEGKSILAALSIDGCVYLCDTLTILTEYKHARITMVNVNLVLKILTSWRKNLNNRKLGPHLAALIAALCVHFDTHTDLIVQGAVRLVIQLYQNFGTDEHVRLSAISSLNNLAASEDGRKSIMAEDGLRILLRAAEVESHVDVIREALNGLLKFAENEQYASIIGSPSLNGLLTVVSFLYTDNQELKELSSHLLKYLLVSRGNRRGFLGLEGDDRDEYLSPLVGCLPTEKVGADKKHSSVSFVVECAVNALRLLSLEKDPVGQDRIVNSNVAVLLHNLFQSEGLTPDTKEDIIAFFAELAHGDIDIQRKINKHLRGDLVNVLLAFNFHPVSAVTRLRCLSGLLALARSPEFHVHMLEVLEDLVRTAKELVMVKRSEDSRVFDASVAIIASILAEFVGNRQAQTQVFLQNLDVFIDLIELGKTAEGGIRLELVLTSANALASLVATSKEFQQAFMSRSGWRLRFFFDLLRLDESALLRELLVGSIGLVTVERSITPDITTDEVISDKVISLNDFRAKVKLHPMWFLWRQVLRIFAVLLSEPEFQEYILMDVVPVGELLPAVVKAVQCESDVHVQILGSLIAAEISCVRFAKVQLAECSPLMNAVVDVVRTLRSGPAAAGVLAGSGGQRNSVSLGNPTIVEQYRYFISLFMLMSLGKELVSLAAASMSGVAKASKGRRKFLEVEERSHVLSEENTKFLIQLPHHLVRRLEVDGLSDVLTRTSGRSSALIAPLDQLTVEVNIIVMAATQRALLGGGTLTLEDRLFEGLLSVTLQSLKSEALRSISEYSIDLLVAATFKPSSSPKGGSTTSYFLKALECLRLAQSQMQAPITALLANIAAETDITNSFSRAWDIETLQKLLFNQGRPRYFALGLLGNVAAYAGGPAVVEKLKAWRIFEESEASNDMYSEKCLYESMRILSNLSKADFISESTRGVFAYLGAGLFEVDRMLRRDQRRVLEGADDQREYHDALVHALRALGNVAETHAVDLLTKGNIVEGLLDFVRDPPLPESKVMAFRVLANLAQAAEMSEYISDSLLQIASPGGESELSRLAVVAAGRFGGKRQQLPKLMDLMTGKIEENPVCRKIACEIFHRIDPLDLANDERMFDNIGKRISEGENAEVLGLVALQVSSSDELWSRTRLYANLLAAADLSMHTVWKSVLQLSVKLSTSSDRLTDMRRSAPLTQYLTLALTSPIAASATSSATGNVGNVIELMVSCLSARDVEIARSFWLLWQKERVVENLIARLSKAHNDNEHKPLLALYLVVVRALERGFISPAELLVDAAFVANLCKTLAEVRDATVAFRLSLLLAKAEASRLSESQAFQKLASTLLRVGFSASNEVVAFAISALAWVSYRVPGVLLENIALLGRFIDRLTDVSDPLTTTALSGPVAKRTSEIVLFGTRSNAKEVSVVSGNLARLLGRPSGRANATRIVHALARMAAVCPERVGDHIGSIAADYATIFPGYSGMFVLAQSLTHSQSFRDRLSPIFDFQKSFPSPSENDFLFACHAFNTLVFEQPSNSSVLVDFLKFSASSSKTAASLRFLARLLRSINAHAIEGSVWARKVLRSTEYFDALLGVTLATSGASNDLVALEDLVYCGTRAVLMNTGCFARAATSCAMLESGNIRSLLRAMGTSVLAAALDSADTAPRAAQLLAAVGSLDGLRALAKHEFETHWRCEDLHLLDLVPDLIGNAALASSFRARLVKCLTVGKLRTSDEFISRGLGLFLGNLHYVASDVGAFSDVKFFDTLRTMAVDDRQSLAASVYALRALNNAVSLGTGGHPAREWVCGLGEEAVERLRRGDTLGAEAGEYLVEGARLGRLLGSLFQDERAENLALRLTCRVYAVLAKQRSLSSSFQGGVVGLGVVTIRSVCEKRVASGSVVEWWNVEHASAVETMLEISFGGVLEVDFARLLYVLVATGYGFVGKRFPTIISRGVYGKGNATEVVQLCSVSAAMMATGKAGSVEISEALEYLERMAREPGDISERIWQLRAVLEWSLVPEIAVTVIDRPDLISFLLAIRHPRLLKYIILFGHNLSVQRASSPHLIDFFVANYALTLADGGVAVASDVELNILRRMALAAIRNSVFCGDCRVSAASAAAFLSLLPRVPAVDLPLYFQVVGRISLEETTPEIIPAVFVSGLAELALTSGDNRRSIPGVPYNSQKQGAREDAGRLDDRPLYERRRQVMAREDADVSSRLVDDDVVEDLIFASVALSLRRAMRGEPSRVSDLAARLLAEAGALALLDSEEKLPGLTRIRVLAVADLLVALVASDGRSTPTDAVIGKTVLQLMNPSVWKFARFSAAFVCWRAQLHQHAEVSRTLAEDVTKFPDLASAVVSRHLISSQSLDVSETPLVRFFEVVSSASSKGKLFLSGLLHGLEKRPELARSISAACCRRLLSEVRDLEVLNALVLKLACAREDADEMTLIVYLNVVSVLIEDERFVRTAVYLMHKLITRDSTCRTHVVLTKSHHALLRLLQSRDAATRRLGFAVYADLLDREGAAAVNEEFTALARQSFSTATEGNPAAWLDDHILGFVALKDSQKGSLVQVLPGLIARLDRAVEGAAVSDNPYEGDAYVRARVVDDAAVLHNLKAAISRAASKEMSEDVLKSLVTSRNISLIFSVFKSEPERLLPILETFFWQPKLHIVLVESGVVLPKLSDLKIPTTLVSAFAQVCSAFLQGPASSVTEGVRTCPGFIGRCLRALEDVLVLTVDPKLSIDRDKRVVMPSLEVLEGVFVEHDDVLVDFRPAFTDGLLFEVVGRSVTSAGKALALGVVSRQTSPEAVLRSTLASVLGRAMTAADGLVAAGVKAVVTLLERAPEAMKSQLRIYFLPVVRATLARLRSGRSDTMATQLWLWLGFAEIAGATGPEILDFLFLEGAAGLEAFLALEMETARGHGFLVEKFLTEVYRLPKNSLVRDRVVLLTVQRGAALGLLTVATLTTDAVVTERIAEAYLRVAALDMDLHPFSAVTKFLNPDILSLMPDVFGRSASLAGRLLAQFCSWVVIEKRTGVVANMRASRALIHWLVSIFQGKYPGDFHVASAAALLLELIQGEHALAFLTEDAKLFAAWETQASIRSIDIVRATWVSGLLDADDGGERGGLRCWGADVAGARELLRLVIDIETSDVVSKLSARLLSRVLRDGQNRTALRADSLALERVQTLLQGSVRASDGGRRDFDGYLLLSLLTLGEAIAIPDEAAMAPYLVSVWQAAERRLTRLAALRLVVSIVQNGSSWRRVMTAKTNMNDLVVAALRRTLADAGTREAELRELLGLIIVFVVHSLNPEKLDASISQEYIETIVVMRRSIAGESGLLSVENLLLLLYELDRTTSPVLDTASLELLAFLGAKAAVAGSSGDTRDSAKTLQYLVYTQDDAKTEARRLATRQSSGLAYWEVPTIDMRWLLSEACGGYTAATYSVLTRLVVRSMKDVEAESTEVGLGFLTSLLVLDLRGSGKLCLSSITRLIQAETLLAAVETYQKDVKVVFAVLLLSFTLMSLKLPVNSETIEAAFTDKFWGLVGALVSGFARLDAQSITLAKAREGFESGSYSGLLALVEKEELRTLTLCILGECLYPPLALAPGALNVGDGVFKPCTAILSPSVRLVEALDEIVVRRGPSNTAAETTVVFEDRLHGLYALHVALSFHPSKSLKAAMLLPLLEAVGEGEDAGTPKLDEKLRVHVAALAGMRLALGLVTLTLNKAGGGGKFAVRVEGGRDLVAYLIAKISQSYTPRTVLVRHMGSVWEKLLFADGINLTIAQLLLRVAHFDENLKTLELLGGYKAVRDIHGHCESPLLRKEAAGTINRLFGLMELKMQEEIKRATGNANPKAVKKRL